ncbi:Hypothetical protein ACI5QL_01716 [Bacillus velezensis]|nr:hypothetical protein EFW58_03111 [Bacillus velezensis]
MFSSLLDAKRAGGFHRALFQHVYYAFRMSAMAFFRSG